MNLDKDEMAMPENANFYIPNLSREEMDELIHQAGKRKKNKIYFRWKW